MTAKTIHLNKLLKFLSLTDQPLVTELRKELRAERAKLFHVPGEDESGGDFHVPFWADAKLHVIGACNLPDQTSFRIETSKQRERLYPMLTSGFLRWLDDLKRTTNRKVGWSEDRVHNHYPMPDYSLTLKVDNLLCLKIGEDHFRLVYPYFSEKPILTDIWGRIGLWLMSEALAPHSIAEMEILDVIRGRSYSGSQLFLKGDEEAIFARRYAEVIAAWDALRPHYGL